MDTHDEILFGRIAVLSKFVTQEQVDECIQLQEERLRTTPDEPLHLGTILVQKKYLTEREKRAILQVQKENLQKRESGTNARRQERIFGYLVMRLGYCNEQQVYECVREQARLARFNLFFKLGEVFVSKNYLNQEQVEEILALQGKFIVTCPGCKTKFNVVRYQAGSKVKCPECGEIITVPDVLDELETTHDEAAETQIDFTKPGEFKEDEESSESDDDDDEQTSDINEALSDENSEVEEESEETLAEFTKPGELADNGNSENSDDPEEDTSELEEALSEDSVVPSIENDETKVDLQNELNTEYSEIQDEDEEKTENIAKALDEITKKIENRDKNVSDSNDEQTPEKD